MVAKSRVRGFGLIEIVVTISILALVSLIAGPAAGTWINNARIRNAANSLQQGLQAARSEAIRRNQEVSFWLVALPDPGVMSNDCTLSNTSGAWVVSVDSPAEHCAKTPSTTTSPRLVQTRTAADGGASSITVKAVHGGNTPATQVTFDGFGRVVNTDTQIDSIFISASGTGYRDLRVVVSSLGRIRMCDPAVDDSSDSRACP